MLVARLTCLRSVPLVGLRPVLSQGSLASRASILKAFPPQLRPQQVIKLLWNVIHNAPNLFL